LQTKRNWSEKCRETLETAGVSPKDLPNGHTVDAISRLQSAAASAEVYDGTISDRTVRSPYVGSAVPGLGGRLPDPNITIAEKLAKEPGVMAMSSLGGNEIFIRPMYVNQVGSGWLAATMMHELLHNITGLTDPDLQRSLGLPEANDTRNITVRLLADCFVGG
jgi:hypothetical protein